MTTLTRATKSISDENRYMLDFLEDQANLQMQLEDESTSATEQ
jgi:hypothetical protein